MESSPSSGPKDPIDFRILASAIVGALVLVVVVFFVIMPNWGRRPLEQGPPLPVTSRLRPEQVRELVALKNRAVGLLENEKLAEADPLFLQLVERLPEEPLPLRNLAIARVLAFDSGAITAEAAQSVLGELSKLEPDAVPALWLQAKVLLKQRDQAATAAERSQYLQQAVALLERAMQQEPRNAVLWFEAYEAVRFADEGELQQKAVVYLEQAYELRSDNLYVLVEWLVQQAERKDPAITQTLEQARTVLAPLEAGIRRRANADVNEYLTSALEAARAMDWSKVLMNARRVLPLVRSEEISRSDSRRIKLNPLEYVLYEFSPNFHARYPLPPPPAEEPIPVSWMAWDAADWPESLEGVRDVRWVDADLDGAPELIVLRDQVLETYARQDNAGWTRKASVELPAGLDRLEVADFDRDTIPPAGVPVAAESSPKSACFEADLDAVVFGPGGLVVLRNELAGGTGEHAWQVVEQEGLQELRDVYAVLPVDFDHEGDLDLVVSSAQGISLWGNLENMTFSDLSEFSQLPPKDRVFTSMRAVDWDRDLDTDVILAGPGGPTGLLENLRHGQLRWLPWPTADQPLPSATSVALLDADHDASWDLALATAEGLRLWKTKPGNATASTAPQLIPLADPGAQGLVAWDYDNDTHTDLLAYSEQALQLYRGAREGNLAAAGSVSEQPAAGIQRVEVADVDADGDLDLLVVAGGVLSGWRNEGGNQNHWLELRIRGEAEEKSGRVNHYGVGSLLELHAAGDYQAQIVERPVTHFGLGKKAAADAVRVLWTNGVPQAVIEPQADQLICEKMTLKGSCPYLYTWDGERFAFFTDLLWAAPLGLQLDDGVLAPSRPWEYLKVSGDRLQPRDGDYELQITEELWEAAYFDQVELLAVDHPAEVDIYSNEKVGPAEMAEFRVHTVRAPRYPQAARDARGRDVLPPLLARDGQYLRPFERTFRQGLAEEHHIELELGELVAPRRILLYLTGWIYPTDTSLNIALGQNPQLAAPRPPAIHVPDGEGGWREAVPYMGFPGGKTKTIVVDVSSLFAAADYRLRIVTSAELYWDEIFFTVDEEPAEVRITPLELQAADLHYRGFSRPLPRRDHAPEEYDYEQVSREPRWPPMAGAWTRYGDVRPLLRHQDDQLVVMASGDEMTLRFTGLPAPPPGWRRDFILHNVGWDKDADLHTVYGQTVEPLPFVAMPSYPYLPELYPQSPSLELYRRQYQTRHSDFPGFWNWVRDYPGPAAPVSRTR